MTEELKPCPFCGEVPPKDSHYQNQGYKWGGIQCCIEGPEVRTSYKDWPAWKDEAIAEWNIRTDQWQPIETAPKDGTYILLHIAKANSRDTQHRARKMHVGFWNVKRKHFGCGNDKFFPVTHWMPLPDPPK